MADKRLKIVFSGISTLSPGPPRTENETPPDKAYVLMAAYSEEKTKKNDWEADILPHFPYVYVPNSVLVEPAPAPAEPVDDEKLGRCSLYFLQEARVTLDPPPAEKLDYYIDKEHGLAERPGSDDVADENDIRWLADIRDLVAPEHARPKNTPDAPGPETAVIVELSGGMFRAEFPCKSVQAQTFRAANGATVPGIRRVLANEFSIEMRYPETVSEVKLRFQSLRGGSSETGVAGNELTLRLREDGESLVVYMGNDTKSEARLATSPIRCNARARSAAGQPVLRPRDDDFFLHYELLSITPDVPRFLPHSGHHQTSGDGCKPAGTGGG